MKEQIIRKMARAACWMLIFTFMISPAFAQTNTEQNLRDAIMKDGEGFTQEQLKEMDRNKDGKTDVADIVNLVKSATPSVPAANFESFTTDSEEGAGTIKVKVNFSTKFTGTLNYAVSGTAAAGADFQMLNGSVSVNGVYVNIPITLTDDNLLEDSAETIELTLLEGEGYVQGASTFHTVFIYDNDAEWSGVIETNGTSVHFKMKIVQTPISATGALVTDGYGIIPKNGESSEWIANPVSLNTVSFNATVENITVPQTLTLTDISDIKRKLVFQADSQQADHVVNPKSEIRGKVEEYVTCPSAKQFEYRTVGTFTLIKGVSSVTVQ